MSRVRNSDTKMEGELLALTYGAVVARVLKDYERAEEVNTQVKLRQNLNFKFSPKKYSIKFEYSGNL